MATSIINRDDPGTRWYLRYLDYIPDNPWGALNTGANFSQGKAFTFSKRVSWAGIFFTATVQTDGIHAHIVPLSDTSAKVITINLRNTTVNPQIVRVYFLVKDPDITISWQ